MIPEIIPTFCYEHPIKCEKISSAEEAAVVFRQIFDPKQIQLREHLYAIYVDHSLKPIGWMRISQGCYNQSVSDIRTVIAIALKCNAFGMFLCHNHPSGALKFSRCDIKMTEDLRKACKLFDMVVIDHIILTKDSYASLEEST